MRELIKPTATLFIICFLAAAALSVTFSVTRDVIAMRAEEGAAKARQDVLTDADKFEKVDPGIYEKLVTDITGVTGSNGIKEIYKGTDSGSFCGYVIAVDVKGYGGIIKVVTGIDEKGIVSGVKINESKETPGLGLKASEEPFISQFTGLTKLQSLTVVKRKSEASGEIEALSGATITSKAVTGAVNAALEMAAALNGLNSTK